MNDDEQRSRRAIAVADTIDHGSLERPPGGAVATGEVGDLPVVEPRHYRIDGEVAQGGIGRVLRAEDTRLGRTVAIKELHAGAGGAENRFVREAMVTARLEHPSIVPVHEAGRWPSGRPFYAMKLVSGRTLEEVIAGAATLAERLALVPHALAVAEAIAYAHSRRVIHRDIKPSNVVLGQFGETVVIDWGLAKELDAPVSGERHAAAPVSPSAATGSIDPAVTVEVVRRPADARERQLATTIATLPPGSGPGRSSSQQTMAGAVLGTPAYMPPEQARGEVVDERADVYALGALLYHVLAGVPPFEAGHGSVRTVADVAAGNCVPLEQRQPGVPADLLAIVHKAMARAPGDRYPSGRELAEDLRRFQTGQLVSAHVYSRGALLARFVRRYRAIVSVAAAALLALAVLGTVSLRRVVRERNLAQHAQLLAERERASAERERQAALAARGQAEQRNEQLILIQARESLDRDPTAALAWLKQYPAAAPGWELARTIAEDAVSRGVARHVWRRHPRGVWSVAFSPDGRRVASASADRSVRLWDVETGASEELRGHDGEINGAVFAPDGRSLVTVADDGEVWLWDLSGAAGRRSHRVLGRHDGTVASVAFAPDGHSVASAGYDRTIRVLRLTGGAERVLRGHTARVQRVAFSPDGTRLASTSDDTTVRLWDLGAAGEARGVVVGTHERGAFGVGFAPDGSWIASSGRDRALRLWSLRGAPPRALFGHDESLYALAVSPDGKTIATGSVDRTVRLWDLARGEARVLRGHEGGVQAVAWSPDGRWLASAGLDKSVRVWAVPRSESRVLGAHTGESQRVAFSPDGAWVASAGQDGLVVLWDLGAGPARLLRGHTGPVVQLKFEPDGLHVVSGGRDREVRRWDVATGKSTLLGTLGGGIVALAVSRDGRQIGAGDDREVALWSLAASGSPGPLRRLAGREDSDASLVFSPDGQLAASASAYEVAVWDVASGARRVVATHEAWVKDVAFSPDGRLLASAGADRQVRVTDVATGATRVLGVHDMVVTTLAFSPDGARLASGGQDGSVRLWNIAAGAAERSFDGHAMVVWRVVFSPDGRRLASASSDGTVRVWDVDSGRVRVLREHRDVVHHVAFSADGALLASCGRDGTVRVWSLDGAAELPIAVPALQAWIGARTSAAIDPGERPLTTSREP